MLCKMLPPFLLFLFFRTRKEIRDGWVLALIPLLHLFIHGPLGWLAKVDPELHPFNLFIWHFLKHFSFISNIDDCRIELSDLSWWVTVMILQSGSSHGFCHRELGFYHGASQFCHGAIDFVMKAVQNWNWKIPWIQLLLFFLPSGRSRKYHHHDKNDKMNCVYLRSVEQKV